MNGPNTDAPTIQEVAVAIAGWGATALILLLGMALLSGCAFEAGGEGVRMAVLQSKTGTTFVDADGSNFTSELDLAAFSKLDGEAAQMAYHWNQLGGEINVGRTIQGLDQTPQAAAMAGIADAAVRAGIEAFASAVLPQILPALLGGEIAGAERAGAGREGYTGPDVPTITLPDGSRVRADSQ